VGTFHSDKGPLHGITVVVETRGALVYVGRCDTMDERSIVLHDADMHRDGEGGRSRAEYLRNAAKVGVWPRIPTVEVARADIASVRKLAELP
jgi:hypothetical protein